MNCLVLWCESKGKIPGMNYFFLEFYKKYKKIHIPNMKNCLRKSVSEWMIRKCFSLIRKMLLVTPFHAPLLWKLHQETSDVKSPSARTITLRSNESASTPDGDDRNKEDNKRSTDADPCEDAKDEDQAAVRIQAAFRGHQTRKSMKQPASKVEASTASSAEPTQEQLEEEFREDDKELCNAATKIQASFRGHMTRKQEAEKKTDSAQEKHVEDEEELDIDLGDPDLNKAAVKIQASFRGHMSRKENEGETTNN